MKSLRLTLLMFLLLPLASCYQGDGSTDDSASMAHLIAFKVGDKPELDFTTADGQHITEKSLRGQVAVIDLWAEWCGPCMRAAPDIVKLHEQYAGKGVAFIGVNFDGDEATMKRAAGKVHFSWPQVFDGPNMEGPLGRKWRVQAIPVTIVLSPEGEVLAVTHPTALESILARVVK